MIRFRPTSYSPSKESSQLGEPLDPTITINSQADEEHPGRWSRGAIETRITHHPRLAWLDAEFAAGELHELGRGLGARHPIGGGQRNEDSFQPTP